MPSSIHWLLKPGGHLPMSFEPPWYSPVGAHLRSICAWPWLQLFFSEEALLRARARFRSDGAKRFSEIEGGLNQMSVSRFERLSKNSGFRIEQLDYRCSCSLNLLGRIPVLRELFISEVHLVARKQL
jgi:hypothetical protein